MFKKIRVGKTEQAADSSVEVARKINDNFAIVERKLSEIGTGGGTTDHAQLSNLEYENSNHKNFQPYTPVITDERVLAMLQRTGFIQ